MAGAAAGGMIFAKGGVKQEVFRKAFRITAAAAVIAAMPVSAAPADSRTSKASPAAAGVVRPPLPPTKPALSGKARAAYRAVFKAVESNNWNLARKRAAALKDPRILSFVQWLDYRRQGSNRSFTDIAAFIEEHPGWPGLRTLTARAEEAMTDRTPDDQVLAWFAAHPPITTHGFVRYGEALLRSGQEEKGIEIIRRTWIEGDFGYRQERTFIARHHKLWTREDNIARLDRLLWKGKEKPARRVMRRVNKDYQALAEARLRLRRNRGGVDWAIRHVPPHLKSDPGFLYERLHWRRRRGRDDAREILEAAPFDPVHPELWWTERDAVARRMLSKKEFSVAYRLASRHRQTGGAGFAEAEWLSGWIALRFLNDGTLALDHFTRFYANVRYPISRSRAAYWAGRAAEKNGQTALAQAWYARSAEHPTTFHGQLAAARLGAAGGLVLPADPAPTEEERERFNGHELVGVARLIGAIGEEERLKPFIMHLYDQAETPGEYALVADLALESRRPDLAVRIARRGIRDGVNLIERGYPIPVLLEDENPETALLLALMRQESSFSAIAKSHAGARGLMQIMPATAKIMAKRLRLPYSKNRLMSDPEYNLKLGRAYIGDLIEQYDGSYVLALAAYNAGPRRVRKWMKEYGDPRLEEVDTLDWIELIPFTETRTYIQRVLGNLQVYRQRLAATRVALSLERDLHYRN